MTDAATSESLERMQVKRQVAVDRVETKVRIACVIEVEIETDQFVPSYDVIRRLRVEAAGCVRSAMDATSRGSLIGIPDFVHVEIDAGGGSLVLAVKSDGDA